MRLEQRFLPFGVALLTTAIALLLGYSLEPFDPLSGSAFFELAIIVTTRLGGFPAGLLAVGLSTLGFAYVGMDQFQHLGQLGLFVTVGVAIARLVSPGEKFRQISPLETAPAAVQMGMWNWNLVTGTLQWSSDHEQLFGLAPGSFDHQYDTFVACLHPDDRETVTQTVQAAIQNRNLYQQEFRVVWPDGSIHWVEARGHTVYTKAGQPLQMMGTVFAIDARKQAQGLLQQKFEQQRLIMDITQQIRRSLDLSDILQTTVEEVRAFLQTDRVIIFQFSPLWRGTVVAESVGAEWTTILSTEIYDPCFGQDYIEPYIQGLVTVKSDIYNAGIDPCHLELLANFQVRANLVVPIVQEHELWGLLIAHHCASPRQWLASEIDLMRQISTQISIAIQQTTLFAQVQTELTERQKIEAALRDSEQRYRSLVHASAQIVWRTDVDGMVMISAEGWEKLTGQTPSDQLGWGWLRALHPDDRDRTVQQWLEACHQKSSYETEYRLRMKNGIYHNFAVRAVPILDAEGNITEWIGACTDITERKQLELSLQASEAKLRAILDSANAGIIGYRLFYNLDFEYEYCSPGCETIFGYTQDQLMADKSLWISHVYAEDRSLITAVYERIETGDLSSSFDYRFYHADGSLRWISAIYTAQRDAEGWIVTGVNTDITEQKQAAIALQQFNIELEQRVAERTTELLNANQRLQQELTERKRIEEALRYRESQFQHLVANVPGAIYTLVLSPEGSLKFEYMSRAAEDIHELPCDRMIENSTLVFNQDHPEDVEYRQLLVRRSLETLEPFNHEWRIITPSGKLKWIYARSIPERRADGATVWYGIVQDITDRKQMEETLAQTLQQLTFHIENTPLGTIIWDSQFRVQHWSKQAEQIFGWTAAEVLGKTMYDWPFLVEADLDQVNLAAQNLLQGNRTQSNNRNYHKDGTVLDCEWYNSTLLDESGNLISILSLVADISDRRRTEEALRQSEEKFRQLAENIQAVFWISEIPSRRLLYVSSVYETLWHRSCESLYQDPYTWLASVHADDVQRVETAFREASITGQFDQEYRIIRPNGSLRWIRDRASPIRNEAGTLVRVAGIAEDITDRKQAEAILQEAERRWRSLLDNVQLIVVGLDLTGCVNYINPFFLNLTGYTEAEIMGQNWFKTCVSPVNRQTVEALFREILAGHSHPYFQNEILTQSGEERLIAWNNTLLQDSEGHVIGTISIGEDITERQKIEQMKNEFIGVVSHELRTPLTSLQLSLGLVKTGIYHQKPEKFQRMIEIALIDTARLANLVNDILDLERLESGQRILEKSSCQVEQLLKQSVDTVQTLAIQSEISFQIQATDAVIWADFNAIIQTLTNLLSNAIKFSPAHSTITLKAESQIDQVLFQVSDQGRGIPVDKLETIFGRFQQVDASDSRDKGGTGLGLAICRTIIEQHGGTIWVESTLGAGSTFYFTLPLPPVEQQ